jgi:hypothetical protein
MDETKRTGRMTHVCRGARTRRILARLREGWAYDEVGREEGVSERRIRQIVAEHLKRREAAKGGTHANMQMDRLGFAMRVAGEAMAKGDVRAITPFIKAIDRLDRYQALAEEAAPRPTSEADKLVMQELVRRIRSADPPAPEYAKPASELLAPAEAAPPAAPEAAMSPAVHEAPAAAPAQGPIAAPPAGPPPAPGGLHFFPFVRP